MVLNTVSNIDVSNAQIYVSAKPIWWSEIWVAQLKVEADEHEPPRVEFKGVLLYFSTFS